MEHHGAHIKIVEREAALAGLTAGGTHEYEVAFVVESGKRKMPRRGHIYIYITPAEPRCVR